MRMVIERARPGVQHGQEAGRAADPGGIAGERQDGGCGCLQEQGVDLLLMRARKGAQFLWEREGEEVVVTREQSGTHALEPVLGPILLTFRTVPVATGVIPVGERPAGVAGIERAAQCGRAARDDVVQGAPMRGQHALAVRRAVGGSSCANDVGQLQHGSDVSERGSAWLGSAAHQIIDGFESGIAQFAREVRVEGRRPRALVPEILLDELQRDPRFQQVRSVAVTQRVYVRSLVDPSLLDRAHESTLQTAG